MAFLEVPCIRRMISSTWFSLQSESESGLDWMAGLMLRFLCSQCASELIQVGMAPRCGALYRANGTAVPDGITFRPFSTNFDGYSFWGAGGRAFQIVVTRLNLHWPMARRQSNAE